MDPNKKDRSTAAPRSHGLILRKKRGAEQKLLRFIAESNLAQDGPALAVKDRRLGGRFRRKLNLSSLSRSSGDVPKEKILSRSDKPTSRDVLGGQIAQLDR